MELFVCIKLDLALNNLQWLICHKTKPNQTNQITGKNYDGICYFSITFRVGNGNDLAQ